MIDFLINFIIGSNQSYKNQLNYLLVRLNIPREENALKEANMIIGQEQKVQRRPLSTIEFYTGLLKLEKCPEVSYSQSQRISDTINNWKKNRIKTGTIAVNVWGACQPYP